MNIEIIELHVIVKFNVTEKKNTLKIIKLKSPLVSLLLNFYFQFCKNIIMAFYVIFLNIYDTETKIRTYLQSFDTIR